MNGGRFGTKYISYSQDFVSLILSTAKSLCIHGRSVFTHVM